MASGYALPPRSNHHAHSHSYSGMNLSPGKSITKPFATGDGHVSRSPNPNGSLFTHTETSREASPIHFPPSDHDHSHNFGSSIEQNVSAFQHSSRLSSHKHNHSEPSMRSRPTGESDFGRAADEKSASYQPSLASIPAASPSWFSLPEALTSMLVTFPYVLASTTYSSMSGLSGPEFPPLAKYAGFSQSELSLDESMKTAQQYPLVDASILTSASLLAVGIFARFFLASPSREKQGGMPRTPLDLKTILSRSYLKSMALRAMSLWLPFYASMQLGGSRTGLVLLVAITANLMSSTGSSESLIEQWKQLWASKVATTVVLILSFMADEAGFTIATPLSDLLLGYLALATSVLILPPPLPTSAIIAPNKADSKVSSPVPPYSPWSRRGSAFGNASSSSVLTRSTNDIDMTIISGFALCLCAVFASTLLSYSPVITLSSLALVVLSAIAMASAVFYSNPSSLRSQSKAGLALGCLISASSSFLFSPLLWPGTVCNGALCALSYLSILYDTQKASKGAHENGHIHRSHAQHGHHHHRHHKDSGPSAFSQFLIARCEPGSLMYGILNEKDSRRITYFTTLNFGFMLVQGVYGYLSGSLGLLSDTVHMFFDCLGLIVGLGAAIASKWPTSPERPFGWGKLNTLSGFGNGIFLMLVSVEFVWEAIEGILEKRELRHVQELMVVSILGLLVNAVGLTFFHSHAGHDHSGHSHAGPDHQDQSHEHEHQHSHSHSHDPDTSQGPTHSHSRSHSHHYHHHGHHGHDHGNDNMHGIFLHIAADAGGSLAVIISTAMNIWKPSFIWDPLATILIAILIFAAAIPLVVSSGQKLLLIVPHELEYTIKNTLQDLGDLRGVVGYSVPRFWMDDTEGSGDPHGHDDGGCDHAAGKRITGAVHVIAEPSADMDDVRERVEAFLAERNMNMVIQIEREGEGQCWCRNGVGGGGGATPHPD